MIFEYGDQIRMLRTFDEGVGLYEGATIEVGYEDGQVSPAMAESLCKPCADGQGPFAEKVEADDEGEE